MDKYFVQLIEENGRCHFFEVKAEGCMSAIVAAETADEHQYIITKKARVWLGNFSDLIEPEPDFDYG